MLFLYICYTVCMVENLIMYCNLFWLQSRIILIIFIVQLLHSLQMQILDFMDYSCNYKHIKLKQTSVKLIITVASQFYLILRLESLFIIDFAKELKGVMSTVDYTTIGVENMKILVTHLETNFKEHHFFTLVVLCLVIFTYIYNQIKNQLVFNNKNLMKCFDAQNYEQIWQKTMNNDISDAILFYS